MMPPTLVTLVDEYLALRRGLGFELETPSWLLHDFARYADRIGHRGPLTVDLAVNWAKSSTSPDPAQAGRRLGAVRQFARHRAAIDPANEVPPAGLLGRHRQRKQPHIYSDAEIAALLEQASLLLPHRGLRPRTYVAFFSLLAATGLRLSEARHLSFGDVDLREGVITVREGKFRKSRLVPLHPSTAQALTGYVAHRTVGRDIVPSDRFFCTDHAPALARAAVEKTFSRLRQRLGWTADGRARRPRIHDLRHTFAVRRLLRWHSEGADVDRKILALSTYLGHAKATDTYWYVSAVPELMAVISERFKRFATGEQESAS
jgi:integrase